MITRYALSVQPTFLIGLGYVEIRKVLLYRVTNASTDSTNGYEGYLLLSNQLVLLTELLGTATGSLYAHLIKIQSLQGDPCLQFGDACCCIEKENENLELWGVFYFALNAYHITIFIF